MNEPSPPMNLPRWFYLGLSLLGIFLLVQAFVDVADVLGTVIYGLRTSGFAASGELLV